MAVVGIRNRDVPAVIRIATETADHGVQLQREAVVCFERVNHLAGDLAIVNVGACFSTGGGNFLLRIAPFHHQRRPLFNLLVIFGVAHAVEQRALLQRTITRAQEVNVVIAPHETHVWHGVDKAFWLRQHAARHLVRPELTGNLEGFVNINGFFNADGAVGFLRGIVEFHQRRVPGPGVVPAVRALFCHALHLLNHGNRPVWLKLLQPCTQRGAHNSTTDQQYIRLVHLTSLRLSRHRNRLGTRVLCVGYSFVFFHRRGPYLTCDLLHAGKNIRTVTLPPGGLNLNIV